MFRKDERRKYLKPKQKIYLLNHIFQQKILNKFGGGIKYKIDKLPNLYLDHNTILDWINNNDARKYYNEIINRRPENKSLPESVSEADGYILYAITRFLNIKHALEIGTHLGFSTLHIALALKENALLTTVDLRDMNNEKEKLYTQYGSNISPNKLLANFQVDGKVDFVISDSSRYVNSSKNKFDFIFIDGNHSEVGAYFDILHSIIALNDDGVIILHDYNNPYDPTPNIQKGMYGVYWAIERVKKIFPDINTIPIKSVPYGGNDNYPTSLALLSKTR